MSAFIWRTTYGWSLMIRYGSRTVLIPGLRTRDAAIVALEFELFGRVNIATTARSNERNIFTDARA